MRKLQALIFSKYKILILLILFFIIGCVSLQLNLDSPEDDSKKTEIDTSLDTTINKKDSL